jgi:hypothetical protein
MDLKNILENALKVGKTQFATVKSALTVANHKLEGSYSLNIVCLLGKF